MYPPESLTKLVLARGKLVFTEHELFHFLPVLMERKIIVFGTYFIGLDKYNREEVILGVTKQTQEVEVKLCGGNWYRKAGLTHPFIDAIVDPDGKKCYEEKDVRIPRLYKNTSKWVRANVPHRHEEKCITRFCRTNET